MIRLFTDPATAEMLRLQKEHILFLHRHIDEQHRILNEMQALVERQRVSLTTITIALAKHIGLDIEGLP